MSYKYLVGFNSTSLATAHALRSAIRTLTMFQAMSLATRGFALEGIRLHYFLIAAACCLMLGCRT
jgi:hypothetical protein